MENTILSTTMNDSDWWNIPFGEDDCEEENSISSGYGIKNDVHKIKQELQLLRRKKNPLTKQNVQKTEELNKKLEEMQRKCFHVWEIVELFTHIRQFCAICDKENVDYRHY